MDLQELLDRLRRAWGVFRAEPEGSPAEEHPQDRAGRLDAARRDIMRRYPEAADEIATTPVRDDEDLINVGRFAAAWPVRRERLREMGELAGGGARARNAKEREQERARYEYGLNYDRNAYTPPGGVS